VATSTIYSKIRNAKKLVIPKYILREKFNFNVDTTGKNFNGLAIPLRDNN
jgi:hypothetical protein